MIEVLVLDLDDTLYLERDYVRSGFSAVAGHLEDRGAGSAEAIFDHLWSEFESGRRRDAFDNLIAEFPHVAEVASIEGLVEHYRSHQPAICLAEPDAFSRLQRSGIEMALISDGWTETQRAKLGALGVSSAFSETILTGLWGRRYWKPHHRAFEAIENVYGLKGPRLAYVADNPSKDFEPPNQRGWLSVRIRMRGQLHEHLEPETREHEPQLEVSSLHDIPSWLESSSRQPT